MISGYIPNKVKSIVGNDTLGPTRVCDFGRATARTLNESCIRFMERRMRWPHLFQLMTSLLESQSALLSEKSTNLGSSVA